jgi:hypothetical protein
MRGMWAPATEMKMKHAINDGAFERRRGEERGDDKNKHGGSAKLPKTAQEKKSDSAGRYWLTRASGA